MWSRIYRGNNRPDRKDGKANPTLPQRALSLRVFEWLQWRSINGRLKKVSCRKALLELNRRGLVTLPAAEESCFKRSRRPPFVDLH